MSQSSNSDSNYSVYRQNSGQHYYSRWTAQEDALLEKAVNEVGPQKWMLVSKYIPGRTAVQCSARWSGALNPNIHKGRWSKAEDQALMKAVKHFQNRTKIRSTSLVWNNIAQYIPHRTGIQCQARWSEALDPAVRKGRWHPEENEQLREAVRQCGCCWIRVADMIPTRTQRQCRTRWNQMKANEMKQRAASATKLASNQESKLKDEEEQKEDETSKQEFNETLTIDTDISSILPPQIDTTLFTMDDMLPQNMQFLPSPNSSRMGSISSDPPTPSDNITNQLQVFMDGYQDLYYPNINPDLILPTDFNSFLNCFNSL